MYARKQINKKKKNIKLKGNDDENESTRIHTFTKFR